MKLGGRLQAAIEVLEEVEGRKRPVAEALKDWGRNHRFAGSGDRSAIGNIVYDALRSRASHAWKMGEETPRALALATMAFDWNKDVEALNALIADDNHAPAPLSEAEIAAIQAKSMKDAPFWVRGDIPEWLEASFMEAFQEEALLEARAFSQRPPVDIRVNRLKTSIEKVEKELSRFNPRRTALGKDCLRFPAGKGDSRQPNIQGDPAFRKGFYEVQDEGSQIVSSLIYPRPGEQVLDYCAGGGGKTLAMAAQMENKGQIYAYDADASRLAPIVDRLTRAGVRNAQTRTPNDGALDDLLGRMDRVVVDAPCTGTGTWRRRPETKWKLTEEQLGKRVEEQQLALAQARQFVRPGGYLVYITCSVLAAENEDQIYHFIENNPDFELVSAGEVWQDLYGFDAPKPWSSDMMSVTLTPASTQTDGFFFSVLERRPE
ncbi:RsmB/NOP family class I SAM-dependent RNA methyltransferase [Cohaesibacter sp. CAU 1516]|uniref:RsmB/NOP family class I SAM-dependent RNA methyltransferase n=1 Tax=Cohaesibacter sp. CAU 1516 TaxID=2576038 RepID=UPI0010FD4068|nr:RsmB/NOP family class I SAM-dependent RNA methyltransferase [Cohaesibacter sp. CAU 1516]TLP48869.1 RsmB/NOP family class I SAM-dependent RNA methyltransferase [Cohaesibacter sp. CAU 1516]